MKPYLYLLYPMPEVIWSCFPSKTSGGVCFPNRETRRKRRKPNDFSSPTPALVPRRVRSGLRHPFPHSPAIQLSAPHRTTPHRPSNPQREFDIQMTSRRAACDPCRKAKLACGHERPVCARCRHSKKASACVYRASPFKRRPHGASSPGAVIRSPRIRYICCWNQLAWMID